MDVAAFRERLAADGYDEAVDKVIAPGFSNELHDHPFDARLLIVEGALMLGTPSGEVTFGPGEVCDVPRGQRHRERYGAAGATLLIGRRRR